MLPTFVIGLREGLEAALIVSVIATFLSRQGRRDLLRWVFAGVTAAVVLCLGVGIALDIVSANLPQKQQEGLETVVGALAVGMVTYMVVWMHRHSRELKGQLEGHAADAIGAGGSRAGRAMVGMAFLAVLREGFETVVFLLAAFNASDNTSAAGGGAVLGIVVAVLLGYGIYRGGVRLNLSKFFRATGLVLVLVAAGLVVNALHTAHEAGWLNSGQGQTVDLTWLVRPGSVQSSLLTGMLGIQDHPVVIEVIGWFAYLIPVGLYVGWPAGRAPSRRTRLRAGAAVAVVAAVVAVVLPLAAPSRPAQNPETSAGALTARLTSLTPQLATIRTVAQTPASPGAAVGTAELITVRFSGTTRLDGVLTSTYSTTRTRTGAAGRASTLTYAQLAKLNGGRLPLGVAPRTATGTTSTTGTVAVAYTGSTVLTVSVELRTGRVLQLTWTHTVRASAVNTPVGTVPLSTPVASARSTFPAQVTAAAVTAARADLAAADRRSDLFLLAWAAGVIAVLALVVALVSGFPRRDRRNPVSPQTVTSISDIDQHARVS